MYSTDGRLIKSFESIIDGARYVGKGKMYCNSIRDCLTGYTLISFGKYIWRYKGHPFDEFPLKKRYHHVQVNCYTKDDVFVKQFDYIKDAAEFVGRSPDSISCCCKHISKTSGGYKFFYLDDPTQPDKSKIIA